MKTTSATPLNEPSRGLIPALAACCLVLLLSACGQRGPLFLPDDEPRAETPATPDASEDEKDDESG